METQALPNHAGIYLLQALQVTVSCYEPSREQRWAVSKFSGLVHGQEQEIPNKCVGMHAEKISGSKQAGDVHDELGR
jgi:hypothetical protein